MRPCCTLRACMVRLGCPRGWAFAEAHGHTATAGLTCCGPRIAHTCGICMWGAHGQQLSPRRPELRLPGPAASFAAAVAESCCSPGKNGETAATLGGGCAGPQRHPGQSLGPAGLSESCHGRTPGRAVPQRPGSCSRSFDATSSHNSGGAAGRRGQGPGAGGQAEADSVFGWGTGRGC